MATGGRVLHHLRRFAPDPRNTILLVGYQACGTRGAALAAHEPFVKIHGEPVPVRAQVAQIASLSAHADYADTLKWLASLSPSPTRVFITHGEPAAAEALRHRIAELQDGIGIVPVYQQTVELD
jgi:metallo-beta-lactamase family protein